MDKILVDEEGYKQFFEELEKLQTKFSDNAIEGSTAYKDAVGDGWHDNFAYEDAVRQSRIISSRVEKMLRDKKRLKIIKKIKIDDSIVNIGDLVKLKFIYSSDDIEEKMIKLTGKYLPNQDMSIQEISLNSPVGKTIYMKKKGEVLSYIINDKLLKLEIVDIIK